VASNLVLVHFAFAAAAASGVLGELLANEDSEKRSNPEREEATLKPQQGKRAKKFC